MERHTKAHESTSNTVRFLNSLPVPARTKVAHATALAVALDIRPSSSWGGHLGMRQFSKTIFELGQKVPVSERTNPKCCLLGQTAVTSAVGEINKSLRQKFAAQIESKCLKYGGAVSVDGVHLKVKGKHFCDFTVH